MISDINKLSVQLKTLSEEFKSPAIRKWNGKLHEFDSFYVFSSLRFHHIQKLCNGNKTWTFGIKTQSTKFESKASTSFGSTANIWQFFWVMSFMAWQKNVEGWGRAPCDEHQHSTFFHSVRCCRSTEDDVQNNRHALLLHQLEADNAVHSVVRTGISWHHHTQPAAWNQCLQSRDVRVGFQILFLDSRTFRLDTTFLLIF